MIPEGSQGDSPEENSSLKAAGTLAEKSSRDRVVPSEIELGIIGHRAEEVEMAFSGGCAILREGRRCACS